MPSKLLDYSIYGKYNGLVAVGYWLIRLAYNIRCIEAIETSKEFFKAIKILFNSKAITWLDFTPRYRRIINNRDKAI
jgi:hypothetical protein